jgi:Tfp pilus assembly protein PilF
MSLIANFEKMLAAGQDNALLRFTLGSEHLKAGDAAAAVRHLARALEHDPKYSAAWKVYGKALAQAGREEEAVEAYREGIAVAEEKGDIQSAKEMRVFLKRLEKAGTPR